MNSPAASVCLSLTLLCLKKEGAVLRLVWLAKCRKRTDKTNFGLKH